MKTTVKIFLLIALSTGIISCGSKSENKNKKDPVDWTDINTNPKDSVNKTNNDMNKSDSVKIKESQPKWFSFTESNYTLLDAPEKMEYEFGKNYKKWTPGAGDISKTEKLLYGCYEQECRGTANRLLNRKLDDYNYQLMGALMDNGEKVIWINALCKKEESSMADWKKRLVVVADGGNCFFNIQVNITRDVWGLLMVNGGP